MGRKIVGHLKDFLFWLFGFRRCPVCDGAMQDITRGIHYGYRVWYCTECTHCEVDL